ncbi:MAG: ferredoxin-thioredoxin reductase catalytic domain-containing protein [Spirochaetaceae bacterium]
MPAKEKTLDDTRRFASMVAEKNGWKLNPDTDFLEDLVAGLTENFNRYGYYLCPCRDGTGEREKDRDIICPCDYNVPDQKEYGHCFCALFFRPDYLEAGGEPQSIPERRPDELQAE